ncbi:unnamed protein product [Mytilus coruscus]|uniref:Uncharacterized protein n=1 Tax=Mytilus coruscus TaxID=42192 RepID=A0A6J8CU54_MYTCO|nr:unnamed protein product [Mytilus coruscus]
MPPKRRCRGKSVLGHGLGREMMRTSGTRKRVREENTGDQIQEVSLPSRRLLMHFKYWCMFRHAPCHRRFYANNLWDGCPNDTGWLLVSEGKGGKCAFEPKDELLILYSSTSTLMKVELDVLKEFDFSLHVFSVFEKGNRANALAIFVKFKASTCQPLASQADMCSTPVQLSFNTYCYKLCNNSVSGTSLQEKIQKLEKDLSVMKKDTSKYKRSLTSAPDNRFSSKTMGLVGALCIAVVVGLIIALDCVNIRMIKTIVPFIGMIKTFLPLMGMIKTFLSLIGMIKTILLLMGMIKTSDIDRNDKDSLAIVYNNVNSSDINRND